MDGKSASILAGGPRKVKAVLPEAVTAPAAAKIGQWIRKSTAFDAKPSPAPTPAPPAAAAASPPPQEKPPASPKRLIGAPNDPDYDDDFEPPPPRNASKYRPCGFCKAPADSLSEQCSQCNRAYCVDCQSTDPLSFIVDKVTDQAIGKEVFKCFGCINSEQKKKRGTDTSPPPPSRKHKKDEKSDDEIIIDETDKRVKEIDDFLTECTTSTKKKQQRVSIEMPVSVSISSTAPIVRILPDPAQGPDLVFTPVDKSFCELPVCLKCVANGVSIRRVKTATAVSVLCGHAIFCVDCAVACFSQKGVMCPYPDCETVIDTIVLIQNSVQKQQQ
jgi:hypothetical protein